MEPTANRRASDAPRRCFICLMDQDASELPESWVDPCPCTLEAHQDCMLSWVTDCENTKRPLRCPVCKSAIEMEETRDPIAALADLVVRCFNKASPYVICISSAIGFTLGLQTYGASALWTFSGRNAMVRYVIGPDMMIDGRRVVPLAFPIKRIGNAVALMTIAPVLIIGNLFPSWSNNSLLPAATLYGVFRNMIDEQFLSWPPSPQLAMTAFPFIRSIYHRFYKELVQPYECKLNRKINRHLFGLPPVQPRPAIQERNEVRGGQRRIDGNAVRNGAPAQGGILGILQLLVGALEEEDADDEQQNAQQIDQFQIEIHAQEQNRQEGGQVDEEDEQNLVLQVVVEAVDMDQDDNAGDVVGQPEEVVEGGENQGAGDAGAVAEPAAELAGAAEAAVPAANREAPQPPARPLNLSIILTSVYDAIVGPLILPGVSYIAGEALRLVLPKEWTSSLARTAGAGINGGRLGLFQQQWGRSLVGGCLYIVLRDMLRVYTKACKVEALENRRVKNVNRLRRTKK